MMKKTVGIICFLLFFCTLEASAQHTVGVTGGYGMSMVRLAPKQETRPIWGRYNGGLTWRYYGPQRFVGAIGIDLEFLQQGFTFAQNASATENKSEYIYYTRQFNSVMLPIVWAPHFYIGRKVRIFLEAAATFSYNFQSRYENGIAESSGRYDFLLARDNRWGYGLAGGGGVSILLGRIELMARARYYFGFGDVVRNRNRYANNKFDGPENPFYYTPLRSPVDNLTISVGISYRFNKDGFDSWKIRPTKRAKNNEEFKFKK